MRLYLRFSPSPQIAVMPVGVEEELTLVLALEQTDVRGDLARVQDGFPPIVLAVHDNLGLPVNVQANHVGRVLVRGAAEDREVSVELVLRAKPRPALEALPEAVQVAARRRIRASLRALRRAAGASDDTQGGGAGVAEEDDDDEEEDDEEVRQRETAEAKRHGAVDAVAPAAADAATDSLCGLCVEDCFDPFSECQAYTVVASVQLFEVSRSLS